MASNNNPERKGFAITWIIENFKYDPYRYEVGLQSPTFVVDTMEETKWCLFFTPIFYDGDVGDLLLGLKRMSDSKGPPSIKIGCECALLTADGTQCNITEQEFTKDSRVSWNGMSADELEYFLPNGNLTFRFKMWKCSGEINNVGYCTARTHIGVEKKSSILSIRNFSTLAKRKRTQVQD
ncbi:speckle-type POZ protein [Caerostris extrusa]|uniref:Speckle-type POZ protein n=1 Tax=Caerostris extrusa TaxID=172846 RepID=A0AAV4RH39_CAEEX|nr:speckle-type POZ protein [Caerostris extrusa]